MISSPFVTLLLECIGMLVGTFLCGVIPLYLSLSKTKLRVLEVMGAGLLVGASMTVVLPEGVATLYSATKSEILDYRHSTTQERPIDTQSFDLINNAQTHNAWAWSLLSKRSSFRERTFDPESTVGIAVLAGFLVMFLIDQIASPGAHVHPTSNSQDRETHNHWHGPSHRPESLRLTRASSLMIAKDDRKDNATEPGSHSGRHMQTGFSSLESSPEQMPADHDHVPHSQAHLLDESCNAGSPSSSHVTNNRRRKPSDSMDRPDQHPSVVQNRGLRQAFASIAGLIIHAAADGIAMGASAGSKDESLKLVVLLAIMIHKAPAAFGLCTLLMGQRLHKKQISRAVAMFSMSTPLGALLTYLFLTLVLNSGSSNIDQEHIGGALTFSAGTFLFVAMHAVQELTSSEADIDLDASPHHHHHQAHHSHSQDGRTVSSSPNATSQSAAMPPKQILGRTGRVSCFLLGTILPKILQTLVGHHH